MWNAFTSLACTWTKFSVFLSISGSVDVPVFVRTGCSRLGGSVHEMRQWMAPAHGQPGHFSQTDGVLGEHLQSVPFRFQLPFSSVALADSSHGRGRIYQCQVSGETGEPVHCGTCSCCDITPHRFARLRQHALLLVLRARALRGDEYSRFVLYLC